MGTLNDLTGLKFGRWTVISRSKDNTSENKPLWNCKCDCGNERAVRGSSLKGGNSSSCGCLHSETMQLINANKIDLTGLIFGQLTVLHRIESTKSGDARWKCICSCGKEKTTKGRTLRSNRVQSCGCLNKEKTRMLKYSHGLSRTDIYSVWRKMRDRCFLKTVKAYKDYGGRGITVCDDWRNDFLIFYKWAMENGYKKGLSIDRINNDGNYEPSNCRWATSIEQARNKRRPQKKGKQNEG